MKLFLLQFSLPILVFASLTITTSLVLPATTLVTHCIVPPPFQFQYKDACIVNTTWVQFLVFLLFSPWYAYTVKKFTEEGMRSK